MRLFTALDLDDATRARAADAAARARVALERQASDLTARWVAPDSLHITLWFLGEVADDRAAAITQALSSPFEEQPFDVAIGGLGFFPPSRSPRVFWLGVHDGADRVAPLYREVGHRLAPLGFEPESRGFTAHVTIARVKDPGRSGAGTIRAILAGIPGD